MGSEFIEVKKSIDGMDDCIIGVWNRAEGDQIIAYATEPMIEKIAKRLGLARHYAEKFFWSEVAPKLSGTA
jgi:hypothetical protein